MNRTRPPRRPRRVRTFSGRDLEALESRRLMAVFTVNSYDDILNPPAGTVTLRSAIQAANNSPGADTINIAVAGTYRSPRSARHRQLGRRVRHRRRGRPDDPEHQRRHRHDRRRRAQSRLRRRPGRLRHAVHRHVSGLVITGGAPTSPNDDGGGIAVHGAANLVLNGVPVDGNLAMDSGGGGVAMEAGGTGTLTLSGTRGVRNRPTGPEAGSRPWARGPLRSARGSVVAREHGAGVGEAASMSAAPR